MAGLQDFIYELEVGNLRRWMLRLALVVLLLGLGLFYFIRQFNGLSQPMAMDHAQVARQIAEGEGYTTRFIRPVVLKSLKEEDNLAQAPDVQRFPDLVNPPGYPFFLAGVFSVFRPEFEIGPDKLKDFTVYSPERWIVLGNILCVVLSVLVLYVWMVRAFDDRVAITASLLLVASDLLWSLSISGLPTPLLMLLVCLAGFFVNEAFLADEAEQPGAAAAWWAGAAVVVGLMALVRYPLLALVPVLAVFGYLGFLRRGLMTAIGLVIPLLLILPWCIRNVTLSGHPFGYAWMEIFADNGTLPGNLLWRMFGEDPDRAYGLRPLIRALALGGSNMVVNFSSFFGGILLPALFAASLLHTYRRRHCQWSRWFWVAALVAVAVASAPLIKLLSPEAAPQHNLLACLLPVVAGFGTAFFFTLIARLQLPSVLLSIPLIVLAVGIQGGPMAVRILQRDVPPYAYPPYFPPIFFLTASWIDKEREIQTSDVPWASAWYGDRATVWLPARRQDFFELNDFTVKISAMLLTPYSAQARLYEDINMGYYRDWAPLIRRADFRELPLPQVTVLPPNKDDYIYFSDRARWR